VRERRVRGSWKRPFTSSPFKKGKGYGITIPTKKTHFNNHLAITNTGSFTDHKRFG